MELTLNELEQRLNDSLAAFQAATIFTRPDKRARLLSQVDQLCTDEAGMAYLYSKIPEFHQAGLFQGTVWENPAGLVPALAGGTLLAGPPTSTLELLNELRMLAVSEGRIQFPGYTADQARSFLHTVMVVSFELAFSPLNERIDDRYSKLELSKLYWLFAFLRERLPLQELKPYLLEEVETIVAHRPIVVTRIKRILELMHSELELDPTQVEDRKLQLYVDALYAPTSAAAQAGSPSNYKLALAKMDEAALAQECEAIGQQMTATGLVSDYQIALLNHVYRQAPKHIPALLALNLHGQADYERHQAFVNLLIESFIVPGNKQALYGLARTLQRNVLSQKTTWHALNRLVRIEMHPEVADRLKQGNLSSYEVTPIQLLIGGLLCVLGQPLGVRQGNNPTCQSARGISMWSRHAPGKLITMLIDAATTNKLVFRYEGVLIDSEKIGQGLTAQFDYKLDPVSIILVPLLDKIYNEMMKRAAAKHIGKDPHASVNPAFYGHWIQTGFRSVYNPMLGAIQEFDDFVRIFYASFHPDYNGGHHLIYPVPLGIFITDSAGNMLGYHAISLLRLDQTDNGEWRAYFFNPNSQGKQNWGQGIEPNVAEQGEKHGESSLPFHEFVSRVYAFHYNQLRLRDREKDVPSEVVASVRKLAQESWGRKYRWL